jgi:hypothetical protein
MGRRSRKRGLAPAGAAQHDRSSRADEAGRGGDADGDEAGRPPWHPVPLTELCVLLGLVLLVWGLIRVEDPAGRVLLVCGMALGSLGGLEAALREHFTGGPSHSTVLAGLPAVLTAGVLFFAGAPWVLVPVGLVVVFAAAFTALRRARRSRLR